MNVAPTLRPAPRPSPMPTRQMPWPGWLELVVISQTALPAMMFVPALLRFRTITRIMTFLLPLAAWAYFLAKGRRVAGGRMYPPAICVALALAWLTISIANPWVNTLASAVCSVMITAAVSCPVFWVPAAIVDKRQLKRLMMILLACNTASAVMGIAQVYQPERFRPPKIASFERDADLEAGSSIITDDGRTILRPPGLTDSAGGAAGSGLICCTVGLALALTPAALWKRGAGMGVAVIGLAVLFFCQVRSLTVTLVLGVVLWGVLLAARGEFKKLATLGVLGVVLSLAAIGWVMRSDGANAMKRFLALFEDRTTTVYYTNRGAFIEHALTEYLPNYPLGAGPGRIGMASAYFGNLLAPRDRIPLYAETQIEYWILDGGVPLLLLYPAAMVLAFIGVVRTAIWSPDPELSYWAGAVFVYAVTMGVAIFGGPPFVGGGGMQFWVLLAALYGAEQRSRVEALKAKARAAEL